MGNYDNDGEELALFAINDGKLYAKAMSGIIPNLAKKWRAGKYDPKLAVVLWEYHAAIAAREYARQIDNSRFNRASLMVAAKAFERKYKDAVQEMALSGGRDRRRAPRVRASSRRTRVRSSRRGRRG